MNFLAIVSLTVLTVAVKNTAKLDFSNIAATSAPTFCKSNRCSLVLNRGPGERSSTIEFQHCLKSVSSDCQYTATVRLSGALNEFCGHDNRSNYITNVTDITLQWGSLDRKYGVSGTVKLLMDDFSTRDCNVMASTQKFPMHCKPIVKRILRSISNAPFHLTKLHSSEGPRNGDKVAYITPEVFVRGLHDSTDDGLMITLTHDRVDCGRGISKIEFNDVTWKANFQGALPSTNDASYGSISVTITFVAAVIGCLL